MAGKARGPWTGSFPAAALVSILAARAFVIVVQISIMRISIVLQGEVWVVLHISFLWLDSSVMSI